MTIGARFAKWGLGLFLFGVLLSFGIIAHYCVGANWPTGDLFMKNITLWWACPWTLLALGLTEMMAQRVAAPSDAAAPNTTALILCIVGLLGVFAVGYPGYFGATMMFGTVRHALDALMRVATR
jgi:hypothetical protein